MKFIRCGHCKNLAPEWKKLAIGLEDLIGVGAVDMTVEGVNNIIFSKNKIQE